MNRGEDHHSNLIRLPPQQTIHFAQPAEKQLTRSRKHQEDAQIELLLQKNRKAKLQNEKEAQGLMKSRNEELFEQLSNNHNTLKQLVEMIDNRPSGCKSPVLSFNSDQKRSSRPSSKAILKKNEPCEAKLELRAVRQQLSRVIDLIDSRIEYHDHSEHSSFSKIDPLNEVKLHLSHQHHGSEDLVKKEEMINYLKSIDRERIMIPRSGFFSPEAVSSSSHLLNDSSQDQSAQGKYYLNLKNSFDRMNERELRNADLIQSVQVPPAHQRNKSNKSLESLNFIHQTSPFKLSVQIPPPTETSFIKTSEIRGQQSRALPAPSNRLITIRPISLDQRRMPSYPVQHFQLSPRPQLLTGGIYQQQIISGSSTPIIRYVPAVSGRPLSVQPSRAITKIPITFNRNQPPLEVATLKKSQIVPPRTANLQKIEPNSTPNYLFDAKPIQSSILTSQNSSRLPKKRKKFSFNEFFKKNPTLAPQNGHLPTENTSESIAQQKTPPVDFQNLSRPIIKSPNKVENPFLTMPSTTSMIPTQLKEIVEISEQNNPNSHMRDVGDLGSSIISAQSSLFSQAKASKYSDNGHRLQKQGFHNSNRAYLSQYYRPT